MNIKFKTCQTKDYSTHLSRISIIKNKEINTKFETVITSVEEAEHYELGRRTPGASGRLVMFYFLSWVFSAQLSILLLCFKTSHILKPSFWLSVKQWTFPHVNPAEIAFVDQQIGKY